ncbi:unnamed protein product, partial [Linum tenue]
MMKMEKWDAFQRELNVPFIAKEEGTKLMNLVGSSPASSACHSLFFFFFELSPPILLAFSLPHEPGP